MFKLLKQDCMFKNPFYLAYLMLNTICEIPSSVLICKTTLQPSIVCFAANLFSILKNRMFYFRFHNRITFEAKIFFFFVELAYPSVRIALFVQIGLFKLSYQFQTWHGDFCISEVQLRKCSNYLIITRKSVCTFYIIVFLLSINFCL